MKIDIKAYGFDLDGELKHFAMCCAGFELGPQRNRIESVQIHLTRANGSRNQNKQYCLVEIELFDRHRILARDVDLDLHVAIFRALERAGWMSARRQSNRDFHAGVPRIPYQEVPDTGEPDRAA